MLKEEKSKLISEKRQKERLHQQKHREKLRQQCTPDINNQGYSSVPALSCATNKVKYLPYSLLSSIAKPGQIPFQWKQNNWSLKFTNEMTLVE